jgi:hypothetical protein
MNPLKTTVCLSALSMLLVSVITRRSRADESPVPVEQLLTMRLAPAELEQGWIRLFDGHTKLGWTDAGNANWRIEDHALVADSGENGLLCTNVPFSNYDLRLEFKASERTNSGVFLRTPTKPADPAKDCFEWNIAPTESVPHRFVGLPTTSCYGVHTSRSRCLAQNADLCSRP